MNPEPSDYFVLVVAPMDQTFVGPFPSCEAADEWCTTVPDDYGLAVMSRRAMAENMFEYGPITIQEPKQSAAFLASEGEPAQ